MKTPFLLAAILMAATPAMADGPVVVELFTSQGCSSCPPADKLLGELADRDDVIALAFHVDYWNYIGWEDPFSSAAHTERQRSYASLMGSATIYTPQAIVQGTADVVGSNAAALQAAIAEASAQSNGITLTQQGDSIAVSDGLTDSGADLIMVLYKARAVTEVTRGENSGRSLIERNIVQQAVVLATWQGQAMTQPLNLAAYQGYDAAALLLQDRQSGAILAAAKVALPGS